MKRWIAVLMVIAACKSPRTAAPAQEERPEADALGVVGPDDAAFVIATPDVSSAPLPARFSAALPATVDDLSRPVPPGPYAARALANGTAGMRERLLAAAKRAHAPIPEEVSGWYRDSLGYSLALETCTWIVANTDKVPGDGRALLWELVSRCRDASFAASIDRDDVPASVVVAWYWNQFDGKLPYRERVAKAVAEVARTAKGDYEVRELGFVLARMDGDKPVAAMKALQATITDPKRRALVGLGMLNSEVPAGKAIGEQSCKHPALAEDTMCRKGDDSYGGSYKRATTLDGMIAAGESTKTVLAKFPKDKVLAALATCVATGNTYRRAYCLDELANIDRTAAVKLAATLQDSDDEDVARRALALSKFPEPGALEKELVRLGFALEAEQPAQYEEEKDRAASLDPHSVLVRRGQAEMFDAETDQFPNEHDDLLATLANLAKPTLDDVVFEEVPPPDDNGPYQLYAYSAGKRYALGAENHGDWYDVDAVVGLLNALLVAKHSNVRMVVLPTHGQDAIVLAGPKPGLLALAKAGLLEFARSAEAEESGKAFENRVFNAITNDGGVVERNVRIQ